MTTWEPTPTPLGAGLPDYLRDPDDTSDAPVDLLELWRARQDAGRAAPPPSGPAVAQAGWNRVKDVSATFDSLAPLAPLAGRRLDDLLAEWWEQASAGDVAAKVTAGFELRRPAAARGGGWTMGGRLRRFTRWHWVPVIVEVWAVHDQWVRTVMRPDVPVRATERYFRLGHAALRRFTAALAATGAESAESAESAEGARSGPDCSRHGGGMRNAI